MVLTKLITQRDIENIALNDGNLELSTVEKIKKLGIGLIHSRSALRKILASKKFSKEAREQGFFMCDPSKMETWRQKVDNYFCN